MKSSIFAQICGVLLLCACCVWSQTTGPTRPGYFIFSTFQSPVNLRWPVPLSITATSPSDGTKDTSFSQPVVLRVKTFSLPPTLFSESFESVAAWTSGSQTSLTSVSSPSLFGKSGSLTSSSTSESSDTSFNGAYTTISSAQPVRLSFYIRSNDVTRNGPFVVLGGSGQPTVIVGIYGGNLRFKRYYQSSSSGCGFLWAFACYDYQYSVGLSVQSSRWYKVDVAMSWTSANSDLWIDDRLYDSGFPFWLGYVPVTRIDMYNPSSNLRTNVDELLLISAESTETTVANAVTPSILEFVNGAWSGQVTLSQAVTGGRFVIEYTTINPTRSSEGISGLFSTQSGCNLGQYALNYYSPCQNCKEGTFSNQVSVTSCQSCPKGTYNGATGQSKCTDCLANTYNPTTGNTSVAACLPCPSGLVSSAGAEICYGCLPGSSKVNGSCQPCPAGYFSDGFVCLECPEGTFNNETGKAECQTCPKGTYSTLRGRTSISFCNFCPPGTFYFNSTSCRSCDKGTYNEEYGALSCVSCPPGTANFEFGSNSSTSCEKCPVGYFSNQNGSSICQECSSGYFTNITGQAVCSPCAVGTFTDSPGSGSCEACSPGTFNSQPGRVGCSLCPLGTFASSNGSTACTPCPPGSQAPSQGLTSCQKCPFGTYSNGTGTQVCRLCGQNYTTVQVGSLTIEDCVLSCGNGRLDGDEACDDGNTVSGDGCSDCIIDDGYLCLRAGELCQQKPSGQQSSNSGSSEVGIIIGSVVGSVAFLLIVAVIVVILLTKRQKHDRQQSAHIPLEDASSTNYKRLPFVKDRVYSGPEFKNAIPYSELDTSKTQVIGKGAFGVVMTAVWRGNTVAVKELKNQEMTREEVEKFLEEAQLMMGIAPHENVVRFLGIVVKPLCIVTEFMEGGDLLTYLRSSAKVSMELNIRIMKDVAQGMSHLASQKLVHRDLAARNVLLTTDLTAKVSDFGLSRLMEQEETVVYSKGDVGPLKWMAPEAIRRKKYSEKSDVWAFGVTCCEILTRDEPYPDLDAVQVATAVVSEGLTPHIPEMTPPELRRLIQSCFFLEPDPRPNFFELVRSLENKNLAH